MLLVSEVHSWRRPGVASSGDPSSASVWVWGRKYQTGPMQCNLWKWWWQNNNRCLKSSLADQNGRKKHKFNTWVALWTSTLDASDVVKQDMVDVYYYQIMSLHVLIRIGKITKESIDQHKHVQFIINKYKVLLDPESWLTGMNQKENRYLRNNTCSQLSYC